MLIDINLRVWIFLMLLQSNIKNKDLYQKSKKKILRQQNLLKKT